MLHWTYSTSSKEKRYFGKGINSKTGEYEHYQNGSIYSDLIKRDISAVEAEYAKFKTVGPDTKIRF